MATLYRIRTSKGTLHRIRTSEVTVRNWKNPLDLASNPHTSRRGLWRYRTVLHQYLQTIQLIRCNRQLLLRVL